MQLSCIIDGNYILSKLVFTLHKNNILYGSLIQSLNNSISNYRKLYPFSDIYLVSDSKEKSWRKEINDNYKSTRKKSSDIDWKFVYSTYDEFKSSLNGLKVLEHPRIEGDDWISFLVNHLNSKGSSVMILSNDYDIKQLIRYDLDNLWINFMSNEMMNQEKIFLPKDYQIFINKVSKLPTNDIFELNDNSEFISMFKKFSSRYKIFEIDSTESLIIKVISGDISDNIESSYQVINNGKKRGIGPKGAIDIYEKYIQDFGPILLDDPDMFENIADIICEKKKISKSNIKPICDRLLHNMKMVDLRISNLPDEIVKSMKSKI